MKLTHISAVLLSAFVAADAGALEAQHDARLCAVYTAYRTALKDGNKTQLMLVQAACATYATPKACLPLVGATKVNAAAKRACAIYAAYKLALDHCGIPALMKDATLAEAEARASEIAGEFVGIVTAALMPEVKPVKSEADKAAAKAEKEAAAKAAAKEAEKATKAQAQALAAEIAAANALTTDDVVMTAINAIRMGAVSADLLAQLSEALDAVAVSVETTVVPVAVAEPAHA